MQEHHKKKLLKTTSPPNWWANEWIGRIERIFFDDKRKSRGRSLCNQGAVIYSTIKKGKIVARVKGSAPESYRVDIQVPQLIKWNLIRTFQNRGIDYSLIPEAHFPVRIKKILCHPENGFFPNLQDMKMSCTCPDHSDSGRICKHIYAALYKAAQKIHHDPELIFVLRHINVDALKQLSSETVQTPIKKKKCFRNPTRKKRQTKSNQADLYTQYDWVEDLIVTATKGTHRKCLQQHTGFSYKKVDNILCQLVKQGRIQRKSRGIYVKSPDNPKNHLKLGRVYKK
jgi:uncharacterized Zn finger protein